MSSRPGRLASEITAFTGIRGVAALIAVLAHAENRSRSGGHHFPAQLAVDLFFILSGFLIARVYLGADGGRVRDWPRFALARFARIYPLHLATAAAIAAFGVFAALRQGSSLPDHLTVHQAVQEIFLIAALPVVGTKTVLNNPSWSIGIEWWVYFSVFPLIALAGWRIPPKVAAGMALAALIALAVWLTLQGDFRATRGWAALARGAVGFIAGWATWRLTLDPHRWTPPRWLAAGLGVVILVAAFAYAGATGAAPWFCLPLLPALIYALATSPGRAGAVLSTPPVLWLGDISYSVYLLHMPVLMVMEEVGGTGPRLGGPLVWMAICVSASLLLGHLSYRLFERPAQRLIRGPRPGPPA